MPIRRASAGLLLSLALTTAAAGQGDFEEGPFFDEPPSLPQSLNGTVRPGNQPRPERVDRIRDVFRALEACWKPPSDGGHSGQEITVLFAFKRTGEVLGKPKITYYKAGNAASRRETFADAVRATFVNCTPLPFTEKFGGAVAGRPFTVRFIEGPAT